jgi:hypothetical protein
MFTLNQIQNKIANAKTLDFGTVFSDAIDLYKKVWVQGLLLQIFGIVIMVPFLLVFYMPIIALAIEQSQNGYSDPYAVNEMMLGFSTLYILSFYAVIFVLGAVMMLLCAGFFRIVKHIDYNESSRTSDFFYYFKGKYLGKGFLLMIIASIIYVVAAMLCVLPIFYVMVPLMFFTPIFAFNPEMSISDIISVGFKLGNKKWGITFGLLIVIMIAVYIISFVTCGLGMVFLACFMYLPVYLIYKAVVGFEEDEEINKIGTTNF